MTRMNKQQHKQQAKSRRAHRVRVRFIGNSVKPRLSVHRTSRHISAQIIDDSVGKTLAYADDRELKGKKSENAQEVGKRIAKQAKEKGITAVVFDRGAYRYQGRVRAVAEGARSLGLIF